MSEGEKKKPRKPKKPNLSAPIDLSVLEKAPPHDYDAERAVLGALLREPELCDEVVMVLRDADDFYHDAHSRIFSHMMKMRGDNSSIDLLLLVNNLRTTEELELVGGHAYLAELMNSVPISVHAVHYAKIVKEKATLRKLIHAGSDIVRDAYAPETQVKDLLNQAASQMNLLCEAQTTNQVTDMEALMVEASDYIDRKAKGLIDGIQTRFTALDNLIDGLHPNELIILAARPSMGKTALALNIATNVAVAGQTVLFVSLEMAKLELALRLICSHGKLDSWRIRKNMLSSDDRNRFMDTCGKLERAPLYIDDTPSRSVAEIAAVARRYKSKNDLQLIVIDYIGLIRPENVNEPRQEQVAKIARQLKLLARELHVPVLCLAQLSRAAESGERGEHPKLSHLRESGAIEQDADVVMFIHRRDFGMRDDDITEKEQKTNKNIRNMADLIVAKQRNGPTDDVELVYKKEWTRFLNAAEHGEQEYSQVHQVQAVEDFGGASDDAFGE